MALPLRRVAARIAFMLALLLVASLPQWTMPTQAATRPVRHGGTVTDGSMRVEVFTPTLVRLEYAADGHFEDRPTFNALARNLTPPPFSVQRTGGELQVRTSKLTLHYREGSGPVGPANNTLELTLPGQRTA